MKHLFKYIRLLVLLEVIILAAGYLIFAKTGSGISFDEVMVASGLFMIINLFALIIFFRGQGREPASQTMHSLVSVTLKFLLELVFALVWFFVAKKTQLPSVVLFFILYLTFTLFSIFLMVKTLKNKSL